MWNNLDQCVLCSEWLKSEPVLAMPICPCYQLTPQTLCLTLMQSGNPIEAAEFQVSPAVSVFSTFGLAPTCTSVRTREVETW